MRKELVVSVGAVGFLLVWLGGPVSPSFVVDGYSSECCELVSPAMAQRVREYQIVTIKAECRFCGEYKASVDVCDCDFGERHCVEQHDSIVEKVRVSMKGDAGEHWGGALDELVDSDKAERYQTVSAAQLEDACREGRLDAERCEEKFGDRLREDEPSTEEESPSGSALWDDGERDSPFLATTRSGPTTEELERRNECMEKVREVEQQRERLIEQWREEYPQWREECRERQRRLHPCYGRSDPCAITFQFKGLPSCTELMEPLPSAESIPYPSCLGL